MFEDLDRLRTYRNNYKDSVYVQYPKAAREINKIIAKAEQIADEALARWGPSIAEQYGWARPGLPNEVQRHRRIFFTDLERASGADFIRGDYVTGNNDIHAGAYATINHLNIKSDVGGMTRPADYRDDSRLAEIARKTIKFLACATIFASKGIAVEAEEYDEYLIAGEMQRYSELTIQEFIKVESSHTRTTRANSSRVSE